MTSQEPAQLVTPEEREKSDESPDNDEKVRRSELKALAKQWDEQDRQEKNQERRALSVGTPILREDRKRLPFPSEKFSSGSNQPQPTTSVLDRSIHVAREGENVEESVDVARESENEEETHDTESKPTIVATLVASDSEQQIATGQDRSIPKAEIVEQRGFSTSAKWLCFGISTLVTIVIVSAIAVCGDGSCRGDSDQEVMVEEPTPTKAPSAAPSLIPTTTSSAPSAGSTIFLEFTDLPHYTQQAIQEDQFSPQAKAYHWLSTANFSNTTSEDAIPQWRKHQLLALATLFYSFGGEQWHPSDQAHWLNPTVSECQWMPNSLHCYDDNDSEAIFSLYLTKLLRPVNEATIPKEIELLPTINRLYLQEMQLKGRMEDILPIQMLNLTVLGQLSLYKNHVGGTIPTWLGKMEGLVTLDVRYNHLSGSLPSQLALLQGLHAIRVNSQNPGLNGTIPTEFARHPTSLSYLELGNNDFSGTIPTQLGRLTRMRNLYLSLNRLVGSIPSQIGRLSKLEALHFQGNQLTGTLPEEICQLTMAEDTKLTAVGLDCEQVLCPENCSCKCS